MSKPIPINGKLQKAEIRLEQARDNFATELNKSLNDESKLDELLDAVIMAEQDVTVSSTLWVLGLV